MGALDQATPLQGRALPTEFATLRRLLEARLSSKTRCAAGKRDCVQAPRLLETCPMPVVHGAIRDGLRLGAISYDAIKHLALRPIDSRPARLDLADNPHLPAPDVATAAAEAPEILPGRHLMKLKLPTVLREYQKPAHRCAAENVDHVRHLGRLIEPEPPDREARMIDRWIKEAKFPAIKSLKAFDFDAIPALNKMLVLDLARCEFVDCRETVIMLEACLRHDALGPSCVGKTHIAIDLGPAGWRRGVKTRFASAAAMVREVIEARDEKRLLRLQQTDGDGRAADHRRAGLRPPVQDWR